jgi:pantetheine-phosphate adenylyltransferase
MAFCLTLLLSFPALAQESSSSAPAAPPSKQFRGPVISIDISNDGLVYVGDGGGDRVQIFTKDGKFVKEYMISPETLAGFGSFVLIERAARIFDRLIVGVGDNPQKACDFSLRERLAMMRREVAHLKNVEVKAFRGLMVDFAKAEKVSVVLRGIRTVSDLEYEIQMAFTNRSSAGVETVFIAPKPEHAFINARFIKEIVRGGGRIKLVQVYTLARQPADKTAALLSPQELQSIAAHIRAAISAVPVETY